MKANVREMIVRVSNLVDSIENSYKAGDYVMSKITLSEKEEDTLVGIISNEKLRTLAFNNSSSTSNGWHSRTAFSRLTQFNPRLGTKIIRSAIRNKIDTDFRQRSSGSFDGLQYGDMIQHLLQHSSYEDISILDDVAVNLNGPAQLFAAYHCSISALRSLRGDGDAKIRGVVFSRLGAVECMDEMLSDKTKDIRSEALRLAPMGYSKLSEMTKEISGSVFSLLIDKIDISTIPMLLGNRNMKDKWISKRLQSRLDSGE
jgi:hypothetical protein